MAVLVTHVACLFRAPPIVECEPLPLALAARQATMPLWPLAIIGILIVGLALIIWLESKNPIKWDRHHKDQD